LKRLHDGAAPFLAARRILDFLARSFEAQPLDRLGGRPFRYLPRTRARSAAGG